MTSGKRCSDNFASLAVIIANLLIIYTPYLLVNKKLLITNNQPSIGHNSHNVCYSIWVKFCFENVNDGVGDGVHPYSSRQEAPRSDSEIRVGMGLWLQNSGRRAPPLAVLCSFPSYSTSVSLWEMDLEELEILLRKQTHSEEEHARIIGSCSLTCLSVEDLNQLL